MDKKRAKNAPPPPKKNLASPQIFLTAIFLFFFDKSCNVFKLLLVLLYASVKSVGVFRMRDFFQGTDATVKDSFAPLGPPLLPLENRMGRGQTHMQTHRHCDY